MSVFRTTSWPSQNAFCRAHQALWVQASLDYKQRLQQVFFPEGVSRAPLEAVSKGPLHKRQIPQLNEATFACFQEGVPRLPLGHPAPPSPAHPILPTDIGKGDPMTQKWWPRRLNRAGFVGGPIP